MRDALASWARRWLLFSRHKFVRDLVWKAVGPEGHLFEPSDDANALRILVGGDVCLDQEFRGVRYGVSRLSETPTPEKLRFRIKRKLRNIVCRRLMEPNLFSTMHLDASLPELALKARGDGRDDREQMPYRKQIQSEVGSEVDRWGYPFQELAPLLKSKDIMFVNLETPLTWNGRDQGMFRSDPRYAKAMRNAGISIVGLANNHIFDAGEPGLLNTISNLESADIRYCGAGMTLEKARQGASMNVKGYEFIFLAYTQWCNSKFTSVARSYPSTVPLVKDIIVEDIGLAKEKGDWVIVSLHWGLEDQPNVHAKQIELARLLIDSGADAIVGHHPHIPHGIEIYKNRPIFYSLGNFIFGYSRNEWGDNCLAEIVIENQSILGVVIHPISGVREEGFQPKLLSGDRADSLLHSIRLKSASFGTGIAIQSHTGFIRIVDSPRERASVPVEREAVTSGLTV